MDQVKEPGPDPTSQTFCNNQRHLLQIQFFLEDQNQQINKTKLVSQLKILYYACRVLWLNVQNNILNILTSN